MPNCKRRRNSGGAHATRSGWAIHSCVWCTMSIYHISYLIQVLFEGLSRDARRCFSQHVVSVEYEPSVHL